MTTGLSLIVCFLVWGRLGQGRAESESPTAVSGEQALDWLLCIGRQVTDVLFALSRNWEGQSFQGQSHRIQKIKDTATAQGKPSNILKAGLPNRACHFVPNCLRHMLCSP